VTHQAVPLLPLRHAPARFRKQTPEVPRSTAPQARHLWGVHSLCTPHPLPLRPAPCRPWGRKPGCGQRQPCPKDRPPPPTPPPSQVLTASPIWAGAACQTCRTPTRTFNAPSGLLQNTKKQSSNPRTAPRMSSAAGDPKGRRPPSPTPQRLVRGQEAICPPGGHTALPQLPRLAGRARLPRPAPRAPRPARRARPGPRGPRTPGPSGYLRLRAEGEAPLGSARDGTGGDGARRGLTGRRRGHGGAVIRARRGAACRAGSGGRGRGGWRRGPPGGGRGKRGRRGCRAGPWRRLRAGFGLQPVWGGPTAARSARVAEGRGGRHLPDGGGGGGGGGCRPQARPRASPAPAAGATTWRRRWRAGLRLRGRSGGGSRAGGGTWQGPRTGTGTGMEGKGGWGREKATRTWAPARAVAAAAAGPGPPARGGVGTAPRGAAPRPHRTPRRPGLGSGTRRGRPLGGRQPPPEPGRRPPGRGARGNDAGLRGLGRRHPHRFGLRGDRGPRAASHLEPGPGGEGGRGSRDWPGAPAADRGEPGRRRRFARTRRAATNIELGELGAWVRSVR
jgi:hypothetical protein